MAKRLLNASAGPLVLLLIVVGFFWKLVLTDQYTWLESPDLAGQVLPWFQFQAQQLHMHRIPMWDPFLFGGQSLIGQAQPGLAYPLNWLLFLLPFDNGHISFTSLNWYYMSIHYLAALFCYFLCRDLGRGVAASVLGGVSFGLGGYIGTTDWPQMINGAVWGPLIFLFLFRAVRGVRPFASAAFSGLFLGMSWLSGHHQIPIFLTVAAAGVWLYFLIVEPSTRWTLLKSAAIFAAFFIFTGAMQMWPAYAYGQGAVRWVGVNDPHTWDQPVPYLVHQQYSLRPLYLLGMIVPGFADGASPYVGVVALVLAALGIMWWPKVKEVQVMFAVGLAGLLVALAGADVFDGMLYSIVPLFEKARSPAAAIYLFHFAIAVLAAFGLDRLSLPDAKPLLRRLSFILLGAGALTFFILFAVVLGKALNWAGDDRVMISVLAAFALAGIVFRASRSEAVGALLLMLIVGLYIVELGNVSLFTLPHKEEASRNIYLKHYDATKAVIDFLRRQPPPMRVEVNGDDVPFNFGDWYSIDTSNGYAASLPVNFNEIEIHTPRAKTLYGVNYTLSKKPTMEGQQELFRDDNGLVVYGNADALPRVWTVHQAVRVKDAKDARKYLQDPTFELRKSTFGYAAPPPLEQCDGDTVRSFNRSTNSTRTVVDMECRGMVVQSENAAPGWVATVDGKQAPIYEAYTVFRGVVVGPGSHKIEMRYHPWSVYAGAVSTFAALIGALVLAIGGRRRGR